MVTQERLVIRKHAVEEMAADGITVEDLLEVLNAGEVIRAYPEDRPFPSRLMFAFVAGRAMHVVAATDPETDRTFAITAYLPDPDLWETDFKTRRKR